MMRLFFLLAMVIPSIVSYSQQLFCEFEIPGKASGVQGMMIGDDIFLSAQLPSGNGSRSTRSYFIHPDGSRTEIDLTPIADKVLIAGVRDGEKTYFYYLDKIGNRVLVANMVVDSHSGSGKISIGGVDVPGKIYGTYVDGGDLVILCALNKEFTVKVIRIHGGVMTKETNFPLSFDLGKKKERNVSFFDSSNPTTPRQASAALKLMKDKEIIWIIIDEPIRDVDYTLTESTIFKSTVIKLDLLAGRSTIKAFFEPQGFSFASSMLNGMFYRLVLEPRAPRIDVFDFETGKKVKTARLIEGNDPGRDSTYARIGNSLKTEKDIKGAYVVKRVFGSLLIVDSLSTTDQILTVGHYGDQMIFSGYVNLVNVAGIIASLSSLAASEISEGPVSSLYYYYRGSMNTGYTATYQTPFVRQVIDDFEYGMLRKRFRFNYKGYLYKDGATYAIYQLDKATTVKIIKFTKP